MDLERKTLRFTSAKIAPLWMLVFFTGWFIMQIELVGARALTPFFGNSIFVWGSVLAVFMLALAIGYGAGGRMTRRYGSHWVPALLLVGAGALVALSIVNQHQHRLCAHLADMGMDVRWGALLASVVFYAPPMVLAGMIAPYAVHLATGKRSEVGSRAGTLYAVSTVGSFLGSLATSFILIPGYSLNGVELGGAVMVAAAAVVSAVALSLADRPAVILSVLFSIVAVLAMTYSPRHFASSTQEVFSRTMVGEKLSDAEPSTLAQRLAEGQKEADAELRKYSGQEVEKPILNLETAYHRVQVTQKGSLRQLVFGESQYRVAQTSMDLRDITYSSTEYTGMLMAPILYKHDIKRVLIIGLGGGDVARRIETCYPDAEMDVVEIDPAVVKIAQDYFFWKPSKNVTVYTMDGRSLVGMKLATGQADYDWIVLDAFDNDSIPFHMTTVEFYALLRQALSKDGVLAMNTWVHLDLYGYQARTVQAAFSDGKDKPGFVDAYFAHRACNMILVAQNNAKGPMSSDRALAGRKRAHLPEGALADLSYCISCLLAKPNWDSRGSILTDSWAPVERLICVK